MVVRDMLPSSLARARSLSSIYRFLHYLPRRCREEVDFNDTSHTSPHLLNSDRPLPPPHITLHITQISGHLIHHPLNTWSRLPPPPKLFPCTYFFFVFYHIFILLSKTAWDANRFSQFVKVYQVSHSKNTDLYQFFVYLFKHKISSIFNELHLGIFWTTPKL